MPTQRNRRANRRLPLERMRIRSVRSLARILDEQVDEIAREARQRIEIGDADLQLALGPVVLERDEA